jgi:peptidoglycan/LPS O-acetylase OafA/YrhL
VSAVREYRPALDGVRAVAILGVLAQHLNLSWVPAGALGVDVFFVLSGYLITGLLVSERERTGTIRFGEFYLRRALRLFPALFMLVVGGGLASGIFLNASPHRLVFGGLVAAAYLTDLASYTHTVAWTTWIGTWSLSMEEHFYLLWPATMHAALRRRLSPQRLAFGLAGIALVLDEILARNGELGGPPIGYYQPQSHAFGLLIGCGLALTVIPAWVRHAALPALAGLVALALFATNESHASYLRFCIPAACLLTFVLLASLEHAPNAATRILSWPPLRRLGVISYGLYLYNELVLFFYAHFLGADMSLTLLKICITVTGIAISELSYRFYEAPIRRWGLSRLKSRHPAAPQPAEAH